MRRWYGHMLAVILFGVCSAHATEMERLATQYVESVAANIALFKPAELDSTRAKIYARARSQLLGVPITRTYALDTDSSLKDTLVVTWRFLSQEEHTQGLIDPSGRLRIDVEIANQSRNDLRLLISQSSLVDGEGNSYPLASVLASTLTTLRPNAKSQYDLTSYLIDNLGTRIMLISRFTVYLVVKSGNRNHTLEQRFDRIPWAEGEPLKID